MPEMDEAVAEVHLRADGVVVARVHPGVRQTIANARANLVLAIEARGMKPRPILVDIRGCHPLDPEVRREYAGERVTSSFTALALVVDASAFGRILGNLYFWIAGLAIPTRLFSDEGEALRWLRGHIPQRALPSK